MKEHLFSVCIKRPLQCPQCLDKVLSSNLENHIKHECSKRFVYCYKGCGSLLQEIDTDSHETLDCAKRPTKCINGCGVSLPYFKMAEHTQLECEGRITGCPNRCQAAMRACDLKSHLRYCDYTLIECGAGGKKCSRPVRAWLKPPTTISAGEHGKYILDRCWQHNEHGLMWALKCSNVDIVVAFLAKVYALAVPICH